MVSVAGWGDMIRDLFESATANGQELMTTPQQTRLSSAPEAYTSVSDLSRRDGCVARLLYFFLFFPLFFSLLVLFFFSPLLPPSCRNMYRMATNNPITMIKLILFVATNTHKRVRPGSEKARLSRAPALS